MTKILLVEDDKSLREIYGVRLLAEGYDIISAGDGEDALALAIKERPALIVSDVMMPKISGFDMLDILRSTTETRDIKVIMMTALSSEDQRKRGESLGADRYLVKSQVGIEDVVRTVHEVLGDTPAAPTMAMPAPAATNVAAPVQPAAASAPYVPNLGQPMIPPAPPAPTSPLPQPTAPFSTPRPAGLGDRIIQPLERTEDPMSMPIADQMAQELQQHQVLAYAQGGPAPQAQAPTPAPQPPMPPQDAAVAPPVPQIPIPEPITAPPMSDSSIPPPVVAPDPIADFQQEQVSVTNEDEANLAASLNFEFTQPGGVTVTPQQPPVPEPVLPPIPALGPELAPPPERPEIQPPAARV